MAGTAREREGARRRDDETAMEQGILGFATLLIGLTFGRHPVELMVSPPVAEVRLLLDEREVSVLHGPPWVAHVDFGVAGPHRLVAVGCDQSGAELARSVQWVNLPRPEADLDLVLERDAERRPEATSRSSPEGGRRSPTLLRAPG